MLMRHAGLDISDDYIRCLTYSGNFPDLKIHSSATMAVPVGVIEGGDVKDPKVFEELLTTFNKEQGLSYVKVSIPEEKAYLFQTDVAGSDPRSIAQNIEFKLEENVPLAAGDAVFYFDILPVSVTGGTLRASVSVVPREYVEMIVASLRRAGMAPVAFEVVPKAIARAVVPVEDESTTMLVHIMNNKTGVYIVSAGVVCFTSTVSWGGRNSTGKETENAEVLIKEIERFNDYWSSHGLDTAEIKKIILLGNEAPVFENKIKNAFVRSGINISVAEVWKNAFSLDRYIPSISRADSLDYAVTAGLARDLN